MATQHDEELRRLQEEGAAIAAEAGADPGQLAAHLAGMHSAEMGANVADRYARMGARWLADPVPTRLDAGLVDRLTRMGFRRESLDEVRIHRGTKAQAAADALGARAFAVGEQDIFFGSGEFDPHTRAGQAVIAHEVAHVAPPDMGSMGGVTPAMGMGGMASSFVGPVLNERRQGTDDAAESEAHERTAREAERRVYAQDDAGPAPQMAAGPESAGSTSGMQEEKPKIDPKQLEDKVVSILTKWERQEIERSGRF